jgi:hypothetical protein
MRKNKIGAIAIESFVLLVVLGMAHQARSQHAAIPYAKMAPVDQYLMPPMEPGAMCYMMGKQGYGGDSQPHWLSHLMFFYSDMDLKSWGANLHGSPVVAVEDPDEHLTQFVIPVQRWSDGTEVVAASPHVHP